MSLLSSITIGAGEAAEAGAAAKSRVLALMK